MLYWLSYPEIIDLGPKSHRVIVTVSIVNNLFHHNLSEIPFWWLINYHLIVSEVVGCIVHIRFLFQPDYDYRAAVQKLLPNIRLLDDEPLSAHRTAPKPGSIAPSCTGLEEDWRFLEEVMADTNITSVLDEDSEEIAQVIPGMWGSQLWIHS